MPNGASGSPERSRVFFILSKVFGFFALPSNFIVALGLAGVVMMATRRARAGRRLAGTAIVLMALFGLAPLGKALIEPLEDRFPPWDPASDAARGDPIGIVVLGGAVDPEFVAARGTPDLNEAAERVTVVAALATRYPRARIVYSGGNARIVYSGGSEAEAAAQLIETFGVPKDRLILEDQSRNTAENAVFSFRVAAPKPGERWLLVTSGYHMPRAIGAFRKVGFDVEAYPVDYRTRGPQDLLIPFDDVASGLRRTDTASREWIGLVAYWLTGRSSELFPGPLTGSRLGSPLEPSPRP
jgi:uncharacterized SAM-binding protein YcdF (DUF218 family)